MLMANAVHELHLTLRPRSSGTVRFMYVNVVGILYYNSVIFIEHCNSFAARFTIDTLFSVFDNKFWL